MSEHHIRHIVHPSTAEQLNVIAQPVNRFQILFLAHRKAHYTAMEQNPRDEGHRRYCRQELKAIDRQLDKQNLHRK